MRDYDLPWSELDPRRRPPPDVEAAREAAASALRRKPGRGDHGKKLAERELKYFLWANVGGWAFGWSSAKASGGPNLVWEGPVSVGADDLDTSARVVAALEDWQSWLETLAERFESLATETGELEDVDALAAMVRALLPLVVERTDAEGAWHQTLVQAVSWCAQACGRASEDIKELVAGAIGERFDDGVAPSEARVREVADDVALEVAVRDRPPFVEDALEAWWTIRAKAPWGTPVPRDRRGVEGEDGHRRYIRLSDRPRSSERADAMIRAMVRARWGADQKLKLDLALLQEWHELMMVDKVYALRTHDAFGKNKAERYGCPEDLGKRLQQALDDATAEGVSTVSRAARLYLDLCFLHPFRDGNARIARLALDHVLTRDNLGLHDATPIFALQRWGHDKREPWRFQKTLAECVGTR